MSGWRAEPMSNFGKGKHFWHTLLRLTCCKFGPVPRLESANYYFYNTTTTTTTTGEAEYYAAGAGCIMYNTYYLYNTYNTVLCIHIPW